MLVSTRQTSGTPRALLTMAGQILLETQKSATLPSRRHSIRRLSPIQSTRTARRGGASGRGIVASTPYSNFDFSLMKNIPIAESLHMQFRAEFFNVFNIQNYGLPGTTFGGGNFGVVSNLVSGATPRQIQFSLRVEF